MPLLDVRNLSVRYDTVEGERHAVHDVSFQLERGGYLGIVGESGCGKSTLVKALLGILPGNGRIDDGQILFGGQDLAALTETDLRQVRWDQISLVPQSAMNALDPVINIGDQIVEAIRAHKRMPKDEAREIAAEKFQAVGLDPRRLNEYPHQLSGGMRQRAMIAMALTLSPDLIIGDEPTTGLDVIMQDQILRELKKLQHELGQSMILVTHHMAAVAENCDHTLVMYAGEMMEYGDTETVLLNGYNPYTLGLRNAFPSILDEDDRNLISIPGAPPRLIEPGPGCKFEERCPFSTELCHEQSPPAVEVAPGHISRCHYPERADEFRELAALRETWQPGGVEPKRTWAALHPDLDVAEEDPDVAAVLEGGHADELEARSLELYFPVRQNLAKALFRSERSWVHAVDGVDLRLERGRILGLAGESGCGKTTTGMTLARLHDPTGGDLRLANVDVTSVKRGSAMKAFRRRVQLIFQDPYGSLNPRFTVGRAVSESLTIHGIGDHDERRARTEHALSLVELHPIEEFYDRFPHQLSGGQRQRVSIARAIVLEPDFLIADEPVSMLDVSVQAGVLSLLRALVKELNVGLLYVSHDLSTMRHICDEIAIMYVGKIVEQGATEEILTDPKHPYAQALMAAVPVPDPSYTRARVDLPGEVPNAIDPAPGCRFADRCPQVMDVCRTRTPALEVTPETGGRRIACFLYHDHAIEDDTTVSSEPDKVAAS